MHSFRGKVAFEELRRRATDCAAVSENLTELTSGLGIIGTLTGALTLVAAGFAAWYAKRAADAAISLFNLEKRPFLSVEAIDGTQYRWSNSRGKWKLRKSGSGCPLYLKIRSSGRSVAFVNGIYRQWVAIVDNEAEPAEVLCGDPRYYKELNFPVGSDGFTIASESERAEYDPHKPSILLIGYIDFTDLSGQRRYQAGFAFTAIAWRPERGIVPAINKSENKYWYHCEVSD